MDSIVIAGAWRLLGVKLDSGWTVVEAIGWDPETFQRIDHYKGTGGTFSVSYKVERDGKFAFLKAIDLTTALKSPRLIEELGKITSAHIFEARILKICEGDKMDRVVIAIESGQIKLGDNMQDIVPYLIFELADGDVRRRVQKVEQEMRLAWWLQAMHHITIGISQLHSRRIAHQDLKPSNVLTFGGKLDFKVADLGRSIWQETAGPHDDLLFSGDPGYAPPEILYNQIDPDWSTRRLGSDLYMLGSMIFFFITGYGCTQHLISRLPITLRPPSLRGTWNSDYVSILPIVQNVFTETLEELSKATDPQIAEELTKAASELCNPDPALRGHPLNRSGSSNRFSLERYISLFDRLAKRATIMIDSDRKIPK